MTLRQDIEKPIAVCICGWTSYDPKYDLAYHREYHSFSCSEVRKQKK